MNLLADQDVYMSTIRYLEDLGHDIIRTAQLRLSQSADEDLLQIAHDHDRIFVTRDRDFGALVFVRNLGAGVLYLRMLPPTQGIVHHEIKRVLETYPEEELRRSFVVVDPSGHRIRRFPQADPVPEQE